MFIDFASRPPLPQFTVNSDHMANYRRVYKSSESLISSELGEEALTAYFEMYDELGATGVVIKARDATSTFGFKVSNEAVADFCQRYGSRFVGFAAVDPHHPDAVAHLEYAVRELKLSGLNVQGFENHLTISDPKLMDLYKKCEELGIPVNIHAGMNFSTSSKATYGHPLGLDDVLMAFPDLRVCASPPGWPWTMDLVAMAWRHSNLWLGISAIRPKLMTKANSGYEPLLQYGRSILKHRMIFGSGYPMIPVKRSVEEVDELSLPQDVRNAWLGGNAAEFLRLAD